MAAFQTQPPQFVFFGFMIVFGAFSGGLFVAANKLLIRSSRDLGRGYGLDLLGSFLGALTASAFLIPLAGLPLTAGLVLALNIFTLGFLLSFPTSRPT
jgi:spermidine synthase